LGLIDIHEVLHSAKGKCSHRIFTEREHILRHKTHPNKFERIGIIQNILLDHNWTKPENNNRKIAEKSPNT
jgi:hypothetical protein